VLLRTMTSPPALNFSGNTPVRREARLYLRRILLWPVNSQCFYIRGITARVYFAQCVDVR
jgi:hypothetical protein